MFERGLNPEYLKHLQTRGALSFLRDKSILGNEVDFQFRKNYINLYYLGQSLLRFTWLDAHRFKAEVHKKYLHPTPVPIFGATTTSKSEYVGVSFELEKAPAFRADFRQFVESVKSNIRHYGWGPEGAFEQLFIEANQGTRENVSDFLIVDRQIRVGGRQLDVLALSRIEKTNEYRLNLIELKYSQDRRIPNVLQDQLLPYYQQFTSEYAQVVKVYQQVILQRKAIGRWTHAHDITISQVASTMRMIAVLANIDNRDPMVKKSLNTYKPPAYCVIQNSILKEENVTTWKL